MDHRRTADGPDAGRCQWGGIPELQKATDADNAQWLSWEFDPPPGKTKAEYKKMGETWAGFTADWFKANTLARLAYCPSNYLSTGEVPWLIAYQATAINWQKYSTAS